MSDASCRKRKMLMHFYVLRPTDYMYIVYVCVYISESGGRESSTMYISSRTAYYVQQPFMSCVFTRTSRMNEKSEKKNNQHTHCILMEKEGRMEGEEKIFWYKLYFLPVFQANACLVM